MFLQSIIDLEENLFNELSQSANFENITKGRKGAVLIHSNNNLIPIVRTTTIYQNSATSFLPIHYDIINKIKDLFKDLNVQFNNALIEVYDNNYCTMGFHSDQALDLADNSYIGVFSCYDDTMANRKLKIQKKGIKSINEILLEHNSVILFSTTINKQYLHKIILEPNISNNQWLGVTFRLSKTCVKFVNEIPYFENGEPLVLANVDQKKQFYKCRSLENSSINYEYTSIYYTISVSDMLQPQ